MKRRLHVILMAMLVLAMSVAPVFATHTGSEGNTTMTIEALATEVNITVPATIAMVFEANGTTTVPTNFTITNNSELGGIHITTIAMDGENDWMLLPEDTDTTALAKNTQHIEFSIGKDATMKVVAPAGDAAADTGSATFGENDLKIEAKQSLTLDMAVKRAAFDQAVNTENAFAITINFAFN